MENTFIACVTAITALIATIINLVSGLGSLKKSEEVKREDTYYKKILIPFLKFYHKGENGKNAIDFLEEKGVDRPFIPPYIRYVYYNKSETDVKRVEQLQKLLIIDYVELYENEDRVINRFFKIIGRIGKVGSVVSYVFLLIISALGFCTIVYVILESVKEREWIMVTAAVLVFLFIVSIDIVFSMVLKKGISDDTDMYSTKKSKIDNQISNLDLNYKNMIEKHYF